MEQRKDPSVPLVYPAGADPAYIPGLTSPDAAVDEENESASATEDAGTEPLPKPVAREGADADSGEPASDVPGSAATAESEPTTSKEDPAPGKEPEGSSSGQGAGEDAEGAGDGPAFEVSDRRGSIKANRTGISFHLDQEEAEFDWDEIGAVKVDTPRFGRRFTVTVYTTTLRTYEAEVEAPSRNRLKEWAAEFDVVLDACFEEADDEDMGSGAAGEEETKSGELSAP